VIVKNIWKIFVVEFTTATSQALKYDVTNFCQHLLAILCNVSEALSDPYLHCTLSIYATLT